MNRPNFVSAAILSCALLAIAGCSDDSAGHQRSTRKTCDPVEDPRCDSKVTGGVEGSLSEVFGSGEFGNMTIGSGEPLGRSTNVNKHLWLASLDTLSFLPIASTDPFTGVIATDWSSAPNAPNERLKVTAFVKNTSLTAEALKVAVYREQLAENGVWIAVPVDAKTPRQLEDAILTRARQLRRDELEAKDG